MLITPRPADNLRGPGPGTASQRLLAYLEWATQTAGILRHQISDKDVDDLILTRRYHALLAGSATLNGSSQQRLVNGLVHLELAERAVALETAETTLYKQIERWSSDEYFVVADSSFYIQNPARFEDADLHAILGLPGGEDLRLLFPMSIVDELDGLKESGKQRSRYRASHTLGVLDRVLSGGTAGVLRRAVADTFAPVGGVTGVMSVETVVQGKVAVEIVLDQPGHVRLPITDDEIIDRAVAVQALAGRPVRLLTCDTGQHTRGRAAGLKVTKVPAKDPGPEPDWEAEEARQGNGTRAKRRERQAARDAEQQDGAAGGQPS